MSRDDRAGAQAFVSRRSFGVAAVLVVFAAAVGSCDRFLIHGGGVRKVFRAVSLRPAQVLDLSVWKIGLPTTQQVTNPALERFTDDSFKAVSVVQFTARCGDQAQAGSKYPRSELREMQANGTNAAWSSSSGQHIMEVTQRITHLPVVKPKLICAQIHSETEYLIMIELSGSKLAVRYVNEVVGMLDPAYKLGTFFDLKIIAQSGRVDVYYNGEHKVRQPMSKDRCYFKTGCYVQSSTKTGDAASAYGQVEISRLAISH